MIAYVNIIIRPTNKIVRKVLNGLETLYKWMKPVVAVKKTHKVLVILSSSIKAFLQSKIIKTFKKTVILPGRLRIIILNKNFSPWTTLVLGSKARIKDGIPIVHVVISVSWIGMKKYSDLKKIQVQINKIV